MARLQVTLPTALQRLARQRANHLGCSLAEYLRRLVTRDLDVLPAQADASLVFDLGCSGGSDVAAERHSMLAEALVARHKHKRRSSARR